MVIGSVILFGGAIVILSIFDLKLNIFDGVLEWVKDKDLLNSKKNL